jgi:fructokinase
MVDRDGMNSPLLGGIEAGGTKFICAVGRDPSHIIAQARIPTTTPEQTIGRAIDFFTENTHGEALAALGIASFGPVQLNRDRPAWGSILDTPKAGWSHFDLAGAFGRALNIPVALDTDVGGAALGESLLGAARGLRDFAYVTIGTGIGGAIVSNGRLIHGRQHPEIGHIRPRRHSADHGFAGCCPFHQDCFEGLASGTAIQQRCGAPLHQLPADHPMWEIEAEYIAQLCALLVLSAAPERIILGGGVTEAPGLVSRIGPVLAKQLAGYVHGIETEIASGAMIVPPGLAGRSGVVGALALAADLPRWGS